MATKNPMSKVVPTLANASPKSMATPAAFACGGKVKMAGGGKVKAQAKGATTASRNMTFGKAGSKA